MSEEAAHDGLTVHVVGDRSQHVSVPHPLDVQRRAPAQVSLRAVRDLGQQRQPELLVPEHQGSGAEARGHLSSLLTCRWRGR